MIVKVAYFINTKTHHVYIYNVTIDNFKNYNTPCNICLIQNMCLKNHQPCYRKSDPAIVMNSCERLEKFITDNEYFISLENNDLIAFNVTENIAVNLI